MLEVVAINSPSGTSTLKQQVRTIGTLSIDNEIHDDDGYNPRRIGSRLSFSAGKTKVKRCVFLRRRRFLVI